MQNILSSKKKIAIQLSVLVSFIIMILASTTSKETIVNNQEADDHALNTLTDSIKSSEINYSELASR